mmetsp:Transcript_88813/g.236441  ORF Transcript_88813/g.236441 Transcript_88813/m.236441 type:complete len:135 (+) Transcript_88813:2664-3068(+)
MNRCILNAQCGFVIEDGGGGDVVENEIANGNSVGLKVTEGAAASITGNTIHSNYGEQCEVLSRSCVFRNNSIDWGDVGTVDRTEVLHTASGPPDSPPPAGYSSDFMDGCGESRVGSSAGGSRKGGRGDTRRQRF